MSTPKRILPIIIFAQFAGTSLWFAGNAVLNQLIHRWDIPADALASVTSAVQFGFIVGTFVFALLSIADRFKPSVIFFLCAILGGAANLSIVYLNPDYLTLLAARFTTGFFLAGIYPIGMKIAHDWFEGRLGKALGFLVGALVLGSAFPHLLNHFGHSASWEKVMLGTTAIAVLGGFLVFLFVGDGPNRKRSARFAPTQFISVFKNKEFRSAAFGYFGHMWELYAFWAFVPIMIRYYNVYQQDLIYVSYWTFIIMAVGAISSALGGVWSIKYGSTKTAIWFLALSAACCLVSPFIYDLPSPLFLGVLVIWGFAVIGDSAQLSSLNAQTAPKEWVGTALTVAVSIGFLITIPSIYLLDYLNQVFDTKWIMIFLAIGPILGLLSTRKLLKKI